MAAGQLTTPVDSSHNNNVTAQFEIFPQFVLSYESVLLCSLIQDECKGPSSSRENSGDKRFHKGITLNIKLDPTTSPHHLLQYSTLFLIPEWAYLNTPSAAEPVGTPQGSIYALMSVIQHD
ncbi:uncharacterized protein LOC121861533 [Homarus americanus]|uniref:uncharacterized protein LOC121861533 n=1 Tax=Homarus americanus TaxID=6706 RepID=UPI001C4707DC|nr:uncharacterized protein LOC121861533 [Homarus americanus]